MITNINIGRYGRLGNQLFQFSSAFSLANELNTELWIPQESEFYNTNGRYNPVINGLDVYSNDLFKLFDLKFTKKKLLSKIQSEIKYYYNEPNVIKYYPELWNLKDNTSLHGYFQAKEYVDKYELFLREELKFRDIYFDYGFNYISDLKNKFDRVVSVHIRRGDLTTDNHAFNAELSINNYYKKIISENTNENDVVLFFSDDIDWCKQNFISKNFEFIDNRMKKDSHLFDFTLMSMCDINVMAVSTFSWWSSWLNPINKDKKVFMPKKWWGYTLQHNSEEVYRYDKWIKYENL